MVKKIKRVNLKELKNVLVKIPDEDLEKMFIMHPYSSESDIETLGLIVWDEDFIKWFDKYDKQIKIINKFAKAVYEDSLIVNNCLRNPSLCDGYVDDMED